MTGNEFIDAMGGMTMRELMALAQDAMRYRRLRQNWLDVEEIGLHGRTVVIDKRVDELLNASQQP